MTTKTYAGSMDRQANGTFFYCSYYVAKVASGWEVRSIGTLSFEPAGVVATRKTRNAAGNFIDRRLFNLKKQQRAA